ncbi:MAG: patatin-like phospholipase family protein [Clostridia bacterium]
MKLRVLTIDGGGMRGIIPAAILVYIESKIQEISKKPTAHLIDYIDFIAGTSSGAILATAMVLPNDKGKPKLHMNNVLDFYLRMGESMYNRPSKHKRKTFWGWFGPIIPAINAEKVYLSIFDHYKMIDLIKPCLIPAYDILDRSVTLYTNDKNDENKKYSSFFVKDIIRGATATPGLFEPSYFRNGIDVHVIIDGAIFAYNPTLITFIKLLEMSYKFSDIFFISLGTGQGKDIHFQYEETKHWGKIGWLQPYTDIVKTANNEIISNTMARIFIDHTDQYIRINPTLVNSSRNAHDFSKFNVQNLLKDAEYYIETHKDELNKIAQKLYECK